MYLFYAQHLIIVRSTQLPTAQLDLRQINSWVIKLEQVQTGELAEVFAINAMSPFILNGKLKPLMERTAPDQVKPHRV